MADARLAGVSSSSKPMIFRLQVPPNTHLLMPDFGFFCPFDAAVLIKNGTAATGEEMKRLAAQTDLFSASDLKALCHEAAMGPLREHSGTLATVKASRLRPVAAKDFSAALSAIRPSVTAAQVRQLEDWSRGFITSG